MRSNMLEARAPHKQTCKALLMKERPAESKMQHTNKTEQESEQQESTATSQDSNSNDGNTDALESWQTWYEKAGKQPGDNINMINVTSLWTNIHLLSMFPGSVYGLAEAGIRWDALEKKPRHRLIPWA